MWVAPERLAAARLDDEARRRRGLFGRVVSCLCPDVSWENHRETKSARQDAVH
jgi:hypothetical protein